MNDCRQQLEQTCPELAEDLEAFHSHVRGCRQQAPSLSPNLDLKEDHSLRVMALAGRIGQALELTPERMRTVLLAGLYHDIGRFTQYLRHQTFIDRNSEDHGILGARILARTKLPLSADQAVRRLICGAVALHNRLSVPQNLPPELDFVTRLVRDADKLDIIAIMREHFLTLKADNQVVTMQLADQPDRFSPHILAMAESGQCPRYSELRYVNDFKLLMAAWPANLNFAVSREILRSQGLLADIVATLPAEARQALRRKTKVNGASGGRGN